MNVQSLEAGIERCKLNIKVFEEAIDKERETMKDYRAKIDYLLEKEQKLARSAVAVEVVHDEED